MQRDQHLEEIHGIVDSCSHVKSTGTPHRGCHCTTPQINCNHVIVCVQGTTWLSCVTLAHDAAVVFTCDTVWCELLVLHGVWKCPGENVHCAASLSDDAVQLSHQQIVLLLELCVLAPVNQFSSTMQQIPVWSLEAA